MRKYLNFSLLVLTVGLIAYLSTASFSAPAGAAPIGHFLMYFFLAGSFLLYFQGQSHSHVDAVLLAGLTGFMFELFQSQIPYRTFSLMDGFINFAGASFILFERQIPVIHRIVDFEDSLIEKVLK